MQLIETKTLGTASSNIEFTGIPQNFTDLVILCSLRNTSAGNQNGNLTFNGSTSGYSERLLWGNGSTAFSDNASGALINWADYNPGTNATSNTFGSSRIYITNYTAATAKSVSSDAVSENNATTAIQYLNAALWNNTAAITSLRLAPSSGNFAVGSTISLYGIGGPGDGWAPKATGGIISKIAGYYVHTFIASGTFTPTTNIDNVEYLVIAGGGGGGINAGAGAGAGGYRSSVVGELSGGGASAESRLTLSANTPYTVTVGSGGPMGTGTNGTDIQPGSNGSNSTFFSITSVGGGGGAAGGNIVGSNVLARHTGKSGGSGGGSSAYSPDGTAGPVAGGAGTTNQGFSGGNATSSGTGVASAGGGGAGGAGQSATASSGQSISGSGGAGVTSSITGTSITRASGGSGWQATAVTGGGGGSGQQHGQPNTGGGAGDNGNGGSGIVIVRYAA